MIRACPRLCSHGRHASAWGGAQLCDLGLSHLLTNGTHVTTKTYGTIAFQPVELLRDGKLSKAVDVYSFAMITWEVYTGERIYADSIPSQARPRAVHPGFLNPRPRHAHQALRGAGSMLSAVTPGIPFALIAPGQPCPAQSGSQARQSTLAAVAGVGVRQQKWLTCRAAVGTLRPWSCLKGAR